MITYTEILQERLMQASCCEIFKARYADTDWTSDLLEKTLYTWNQA